MRPCRAIMGCMGLKRRREKSKWCIYLDSLAFWRTSRKICVGLDFLYVRSRIGSFLLNYAGGLGLGVEIRLRSARTWFLPLLHQFLTIFVKNWEKTQKCVWITEKSDAEFCQFLRWPKCSVRFSEEARRDLALEKKAKKSRLIRRNGSGKIFQRCYFSIFWLFYRNKNKKMRKKIKVRKIGPR